MRIIAAANCWIWKATEGFGLTGKLDCSTHNFLFHFPTEATHPKCSASAALWRLLVQTSRQSVVRSVAVRAHKSGWLFAPNIERSAGIFSSCRRCCSAISLSFIWTDAVLLFVSALGESRVGELCVCVVHHSSRFDIQLGVVFRWTRVWWVFFCCLRLWMLRILWQEWYKVFPFKIIRSGTRTIC